ncbi:MAG: amino acid ABC transporter permease [Proteobacteria bacterium]|nr:amino acid ABC transporter permease [Pseudomonadota bacterium]
MSDVFYIQKEPIARLPAPSSLVGPLAWARANLFSSPANAVLSIVTLVVAVWCTWKALDFLVLSAVFSGADREACLAKNGVEPGACWAFVRDRFSFFIYGFYPVAERWRVDIFFVLLAVGVVWLLWLKAPRRDLGLIYFLVVMPVASFLLLNGASFLGLKPVDTALWGGLMVTLVVSAVAIVVSLPLGVLLALGRRSQLPVIKFFSVLYIEFVRGVPLVGMLFMANVMLPLFLPGDVSVDKLLRAVVGISLFASAYMAEVVRAGLQALPKGQYEGAMAMGLGYWQMMRLIILPQALKVTIPNIVNNYVALFKDTSLLLIVGIFDFLKAIQTASIDPQWAVATASVTGYVFAALVYFAFCHGMARYARAMEARLNAAQKR